MDASRSTVLGVIVALIVLTSGCLGVLTGDEPFVATASPAEVSGDALSETDFQHEETDAMWLNETVEVSGQEREIRVENHVSTYRLPPSIGLDGSATFGFFNVFTTPRVSVAGQGLNPIGRMSHRQLIEQVAGQSEDVRDIDQVGSRRLTVLDSEAEVTRFSAVAEQSGREIPIYIEVTRVEDEDDYVIAVGLYPQEAEDVRPQVETLFESIDH